MPEETLIVLERREAKVDRLLLEKEQTHKEAALSGALSGGLVACLVSVGLGYIKMLSQGKL